MMLCPLAINTARQCSERSTLQASTRDVYHLDHLLDRIRSLLVDHHPPLQKYSLYEYIVYATANVVQYKF